MSAITRSFSILFIAGMGVGGQLLAHILRRRGHEVSVLRPEDVIKEQPSGFDFILITTYNGTKELRDTISARNAAIKKSPHATIVLGGPGFSVQPEAYLRQYEAYCGLAGEADKTIEDLFEAFEQYGPNPKWNKIKHIAGVAYRASNNRTYLNPNRPSLKADEIEWNLVPSCVESDITRFNFQRGCPNHCNFCIKWFGDKVRSAPLETIFAALEQTVASAQNSIVSRVRFDGELFLPRPKAMQLCKMIQNGSLNGRLKISSDFTVGSLLKSDGSPDEELIDALISAGFFHIGLGVESFRDNTLRKLGKPQTFTQAFDIIHYLYDKDIEGHFYMITCTVEARPFDEFMDSYISGALFGNGFSAWNPTPRRLVIFPGTKLFERYKDDPTRFRNVLTGRVFHPSTDLERAARKQILICEAVPYDPLVDMGLPLLEMLWGMEYRLEHLKKTGQNPKEKKRLARELIKARKLTQRMPRHYALKVRDVTFKVSASAVTEFLYEESFLERWRANLGDKARLIEHRVGKKLYGPDWREEVRDLKKCKEFEQELRDYLLEAAISKHQDVMPIEEVRKAVCRMYDYAVQDPDYIEQFSLIPALMNEREMKLYAEETTGYLRQQGKDEFVEYAMEQKDPIGFFARMLTTPQVLDCEDLLADLHKIKPNQDSRTVLPPELGEDRKLRKAARTLPVERREV